MDANIIEKVPVESPHPIGETHYLPHRPVIREDKLSTKVRMVFDASAKTTGPSLNDCLHPGPPLTEPLLSVLLRFRTNRIAFIADIKKSFLQILLQPKYRDYVRFLWYEKPHELNFENFTSAQLCTYRLCRLLFGVTSSPCSLTATINKHLNSYQDIDPAFVTKIMQSLHVHDLSTGADNVTEAYNFFIKAKERLAHASFNLRKFQSTSVELEKKVSDEFTRTHLNDPQTKVLGINWNKQSDEIVFDLHTIVTSVKHPTKRKLLSIIASIYDPLGFLNPFVLKLKELFQRTCIANIPWDQTLDDELLSDWNMILEDLMICYEIKLPRFHGCTKSVELHGFCDASLTGFGCCIYVRFVDENGEVKVSFVTSQSRISPISKPTIPKLELQAAVLLSKCVHNIVEVLSSSYVINWVHLYSDSTITLSWIHSQKSLVPYVKRRVDTISYLTSSFPFHWHHISGVNNPADILSRGCYFSVLRKCSYWFDGPDFLYDANVKYDLLGKDSIFVDFLGRNLDVLQEASNCLTVNTENINSPVLESLIKKYSTYNKLIRVTALVQRFVYNLRKKVKKEDILLATNVTTEEFRDAEMFLIKYVQEGMERQKNYVQLQRELNLQEVNGIIRCKGRLGNAPISYDAKFPILLPRNNPLSTLVVKHAHARVLHNGPKETINELRKRFWIPRTRLFVKKVIHKCTLCKIFEGKPFAYPPSPDLPHCRLSPEFPFTYVGIDYAGPLYVKNIYHSGDMFKSWIFLYTCASTRGLYLDLVPDASSQSCIRALRRFISNRDAPKLIISDNGTQFKSEETQGFASNRHIQWRFNLAAAPWWGGMFERMVRSTKRCLKKILLRSYLNFEEMQTVLAEITCTLNNRPLTFMYEEPGEIPLTPNHLLYGRTLDAEQMDSSPNQYVENEINEHSRHIQQMLDHFWKRWKLEYLTELREHHKQTTAIGCDVINVDDGVIIHNDSKQRGLWKVGVVTELIPSKDGHIRGAKVKYRLNGKDIVISRPVNKLFPLEAEISDEKDDDVQIQFLDEKDIQVFG